MSTITRPVERPTEAQPATGQVWRRTRDGGLITIENDLSPRGDWSDFHFRTEAGRRGRMWAVTLRRNYELVEGTQ